MLRSVDVLTSEGPTPARAPTLDELKTADQLHRRARAFRALPRPHSRMPARSSRAAGVLKDEIGTLTSAPNLSRQCEPPRDPVALAIGRHHVTVMNQDLS